MSTPKTEYVLTHNETGQMFRLIWKGVVYWTSDVTLARRFDFKTEADMFAITYTISNCQSQPVKLTQ